MSGRSGRVSFVASTALLALSIFHPAIAVAAGEDDGYIKANYTKYEFRIPMRDGVRLFTAVYVPKETTRPYPVLLNRTPYSVAPYGADSYRHEIGPSSLFSRDGYIIAYQDVRGRWMSEGEFVNVRPHRPLKADAADIDESTDTFDTIDWLVKNVPNNNGKVGQWGISYPGFYTSMGMIDAHPALKAASPQAPIADWFAGDDWHHNGAFFLPHAFNFMSGFGHPRPRPTKKEDHSRFEYVKADGYNFFLQLGPLSNANARYYKDDVPFWNEMLKHPSYDDFWAARNIRPHLKSIKPAVLTVGGWYDAENLFGALETYRAVEASSPRATNMLVMGPWLHGGWAHGDGASLGPIAFNSNTAANYREQIEFPFFQYYLKGRGAPSLPEAWVFETGTNQWRSFDAWPPRQAKPRSLYLAPGGRVAFSAPEASQGPDYDEYVSDPAKPVEFIDHIANRMTSDYMIQDQRFAARRPDVLVYETEELAEDMTLVGPIQARLFVSTSGSDSDWIVKLIDVFPDDHPGEAIGGAPLASFQQLVRGDVMRGRFRKSLTSPEPFTPNQPTAVDFTLPDVGHTFRSGHKLMIQIQSTWFPLVDRNPQTFVDIYTAKETDFQKAVQRVYRAPGTPSHLEVLELPR
ncbi:MAG: CocE/NonD family hydrolase [Paludisphaera borealis]|uniref:CocE/NonD family hydrolase n=1 Tax=Paludisphaera borealis TaxID=1387353 RepID=UPI00284BD366|nr:CocE/NonD family hydrolase [Paludisphaera borealis]MDR3620234.1 CocE/NonD family hydrolase [Paludisphaera borealis]